MRKRAYLHSRETIWPRIAVSYMASFQQARVERMYRPHPTHDAISIGNLDDLPTLAR
jgi:hypothetical protein